MKVPHGADAIPPIQAEFDRLVEEWCQDTEVCSFSTEIIGHPSVDKIVAMGMSVLPLVFRELAVGRSWGFEIIDRIVGVSPVIPEEQQGRYEAIRQIYLEFGRENGWYEGVLEVP